MNHLPIIKIESIDHGDQRYDTVGDYYKEKSLGFWRFYLSRTNSDFEFLVLIHELIEWYLTQKRGITEARITKFDKAFEKKRKPGNFSEPGFAKDCPYKKEHAFATRIEKLVGKELGINWDKYDSLINEL